MSQWINLNHDLHFKNTMVKIPFYISWTWVHPFHFRFQLAPGNRLTIPWYYSHSRYHLFVKRNLMRSPKFFVESLFAHIRLIKSLSRASSTMGSLFSSYHDIRASLENSQEAWPHRFLKGQKKLVHDLSKTDYETFVPLQEEMTQISAQPMNVFCVLTPT